MKNKILKLFTLVITITMLYNCNEDSLLDKHPLTTVNPATYFTDETSARGAVAAIFGDWTDRGTMYQKEMFNFLDIMTDDAFTRIKDYRAMFNNYTFTAAHTRTDERLKEWWIYLFRSVNDANFAIDYIPTCTDATFTNEKQKQYIGVAKMMRAFTYIYLTSFYGAVPLYKNFAISLDEAYKPRTSVSEVYDLIIEDLIYAKDNIPDNWSGIGDGLPGKAAAAGLLARAYLYNKDWANAEIAAKEAIEIADRSGYILMDDYETMMSKASQPNKEFILTFNFLDNDVAAYNVNEGLIQRLVKGGDGPNGPNVSQVIYNVWGSSNAGWGYIMPTRDLYDEFEPGDSRRKASMWAPGDFYGLYDGALGDSTEYSNAVTGGKIMYHKKDTIYYQQGWSPSNLNTKKCIENVSNLINQNNISLSGYDIPLLRYAELLLYYAEALIENNKVTEGMAQINKVRGRLSVKMPALTATDQADARTKLRHERRVELNLEGVRFFDLRRWDVMEQEMGAGLNPKKVLVRYGDDNLFEETNLEFPKNLLLPIPLDEIDSNPFINPEDQNPGW